MNVGELRAILENVSPDMEIRLDEGLTQLKAITRLPANIYAPERVVLSFSDLFGGEKLQASPDEG